VRILRAIDHVMTLMVVGAVRIVAGKEAALRLLRLKA
jgi:hypothetical protein